MATESVSSPTRRRLLAGEGVIFAKTAPEAERTVSLSWLAEVAQAGLKIHVENAVIVVDTQLNDMTFARDVRLSGCRFDGFVDLGYARFEHKVDLSSCEFTACASFDSVRFGSDVMLGGTQFRADAKHDTVIFNDCKIAGGLDAQEISFAEGVTAQFDRAEFHSFAAFDGARFGGPARFPLAQVDGELVFRRARFAKDLYAYRARVEHQVDLDGARFALGASSVFEASDLGGFSCRSAVFGGGVFFADARLRGTWLARGTCFLRALDLTRMEVARDVYMKEARIGARGWLAMEATVVHRRLTMSAGRFRGMVALAGCSVGENLVAQKTRFQAACRFGGMRVSGDVELQGATFEAQERADFSVVDIRGDTRLDKVSFQAGVSFRRARLRHLKFDGRSCNTFDLCDSSSAVIELNGARFQGQFSGDARTAIDLSGASATHVTCNSAWFRGDVTMIGLAVGSQLSFNDVIIAGNSNFWELKVERGMFVRRSRFLGEVNFGMAAAQSLELCGSVFRKPVSLSQSKFRSVAIDLDERDRRATVCHGPFIAGQAEIDVLIVNRLRCRTSAPVNFSSAVITGAARFTDVAFDGGAKFVSTRFHAEARFERVRFGGPANFRGARFGGTTMFRAEFAERTDFAMARFASFADFGAANDAGWELDGHVAEASSRFVDLDLSYAEFAGDVQLQGARIHGRLDLRQCVVGSLLLPQNVAALPYRIDLRGCRYGHIEVDAADLTDHGRLQPHSAQPYTDLERVFRKMGDVATADRIYLAGCRAERKHRWKTRKGAWLSSVVYWGLANYGVRPYRLVVYSAALLVAFTWYFSHLGTLEHEPIKGAARVAYDASLSEAFGVSLREFFPVDLPILKQVAPGPIDWPAAILKFFGWLLVPLGLASVTGILRREKSS